MHRCQQEREILKNSLSIVIMSLDQFAYNLMKGPGYMAMSTEEVVHVVRRRRLGVTNVSRTPSFP